MNATKAMNTKKTIRAGCLLGALMIGLSGAAAAEQLNTDPKQPLPKPDGKAPDTTKPVKVFILMGQSNMVGMGEVGPDTTQGTLGYFTKTGKKYPWLLDDAGNWTVRNDVYFYDARIKKGGPLSPTANANQGGKTIGPELGFGYVMGHVLDEPVLLNSRDLWREADVSPKNPGYHYNRNAETFYEVGERLGWAMAELLKK